MNDPRDDPRTSESPPEKETTRVEKAKEELEKKFREEEERSARRANERFSKREALGEAGMKKRAEDEERRS